MNQPNFAKKFPMFKGKKMRLFFTLLLCTFALTLFAQNEHPPFTAAAERMASYPQRQALAKQSIVNAIEFRNVGPTIMSGRVADLDVRPDDPTYFYVAYASGGLWKTENNGTSFEPLFDNEMVMTIGDIAVDWARNTIWVGTGEVNSSRSSYAGAGVYKSTDGGKSWQQLGLAETHHIGRIVLDPDNPNIAWVAALGHLYSPNEERGVFKTTDGGLTWSKTLYIDEHTGAVDLIRSPTEPNTLYAATWQRERRAWNFVESGPGSGIYKSTDGGESWALLTTETSGFVTGEGAGRIGLDAVKTENGLVLFAAIDNYNRRPKKEEEERKLTKEELRSMSREEFLKLEKYLLKEYLQQYDFPERYDADKVRSMVEKGEIQPKTLVDYVEDANAMLFDVPVTGLELYRSDDGGQSWKRTHEDFLDNVYYTYGYYFGQVRVDPQAPDKVFVMGVPVLRSDDGGQSFESIDGDNVHGDHHALWINPRRAGHLILGNDGGVNISYDYGKSWVKCNTPAVGQFYAIAVDMAEPYRVYGAQATGCSPVSVAFKEGHEIVRPVKPDTIAKSLAIGNPADAVYVLDICRRTGGAVEDVSDDEIREGILLLARNEGIFTETAGGTTVACLKKLVETGQLDPTKETVVINTGMGLKTLDAIADQVGAAATIPATYDAFSAAGLS